MLLIIYYFNGLYLIVSGKRFLHEWSQYRYGVFEESGGNNGLYPKFYKTSTNEILPNLCVSDKPVFTVKYKL